MTRQTGRIAVLGACWFLGACIDVGSAAEGPLYCGLGGLSCCNGTGCYEGAACAGGTCRTSSACPTRCGGFCADTSGDPNHCGGCGVECAAGLGCSGGACESLFTAKWVIDSITLPNQRDQFSIDLDGDNRPDNMFANVVNVLGAQQLYAQDGVTAGIAGGVALHLISLGSHDPGHGNDPSPTSTVALALPHNPPDLKGTGTFSVDDGQPAARFAGTLLDGHFRSVDPVTTRAPVSLVLDLPLFAQGPDVPRPLLLPIQGAHIDYQVMDDGDLRGSIQGSIRRQDLEPSIVAPMALMLTSLVRADPNGSQAAAIIAFADAGGCTDANGVRAVARDQSVSTCELASMDLIKNVFSPDIQVRDAQGHYGPVPRSHAPDALSLGLGFTAVPARF